MPPPPFLPLWSAKAPATPRAARRPCWRALGGMLVLAALLPGFSGCATAPARPAVIQPVPKAAVQKGMTAAAVRALLGEPREIKRFPDGELHREIWVYEFAISEEVRPAALTTRDMPLTNPLTGHTSIVQEPVMGHEIIKVSEITELLMVDGLLIAWKRKPLIDRTLN